MTENWLLIESSGKVGHVGLARGDAVVRAMDLDSTRRHVRDLAATVNELLQSAGLMPKALSGVMVSIGPGSYTGLRVGIMSAKALSYATGCTLIAVPTFSAIVNRVPGETNEVWVIADALQGQIYRQHFCRESNEWVARDELRIDSFDEWLPTIETDAWVSGPGVNAFAERLPPTCRIVEASFREPSITNLFQAGRGLAPVNREELFRLEPLYLRGSSAEEKLKGK
jgi:tRNA threonylcarbamoyladenosine biosynthesis protein TsaB